MVGGQHEDVARYFPTQRRHRLGSRLSNLRESPAFNDACRLVTAPCNRAPIGDINKVLDGLYATGKPVVFYVHGRADE